MFVMGAVRIVLFFISLDGRRSAFIKGDMRNEENLVMWPGEGLPCAGLSGPA